MKKLKKAEMGDDTLMSGVANEKISAEQRGMIAEMEKTDGGNSSGVGNNGETLVINFLNRFLPPQFRAYKGHYRKIGGELSREIDIMIADSRFPILNQTANGIYHIMQHALLCTVEVKRTLGKSEVESIRKDILSLQEETAVSPALSAEGGQFWSTPSALVVAFRSALTLQTLAEHFYKVPISWGDMFILEHQFECSGVERGIGALLRIEGKSSDYECVTCRIKEPLSDFYYMLIEQAFDVLSQRSLPDSSVRDVIASYYNWSALKHSVHFKKNPSV